MSVYEELPFFGKTAERNPSPLCFPVIERSRPKIALLELGARHVRRVRKRLGSVRTLGSAI